MPILTNDQAKKLFDLGQLNEQQYSQIVNQNMLSEPTQVQSGVQGVDLSSPQDLVQLNNPIQAPTTNERFMSEVDALRQKPLFFGDENMAKDLVREQYKQRADEELKNKPVEVSPQEKYQNELKRVNAENEKRRLTGEQLLSLPIAPIEDKSLAATQAPLTQQEIESVPALGQTQEKQQNRGLYRQDPYSQAEKEYSRLAEIEQNINKKYQDIATQAMTKMEELDKKPFQNFWASKSTGDKVMAGIAMAFSGLGMAIAGKPGENPAFNIISKAIDQDIEMQKMNYQKSRESIKTGLDIQKDVLSNELALVGSSYKRVDKILENQRNRISDENERQKIDILRGEMQAKADQKMNQLIAGQKSRDERAGNEVADWVDKGNRNFIYSDIQKLKDIEKDLEAAQKGKGNVSGPIAGRISKATGGIAYAKIKNYEAIVNSVTKKNLREILGGQFAMLEGQQLAQEGFDVTLDEKFNLERIRSYRIALEKAAQAKDQTAAYIINEGSVRNKPTDLSNPTQSAFDKYNKSGK